MEVQIITPHGFCEGVLNAIRIAKTARKEHPTATIHVIGSLVHNEEVIRDFEKDHFVFHDEFHQPLSVSLAQIPAGSVIVFAAHGHEKALDEMAQKKGLIVYDTTCRFVRQNASMIAMELEIGHEVIYIGKKGHAECVGALSLDANKVHLCDPSELENEGSWKHIAEEQPAVVSQTTMDLEDLETAKKAILALYPQALFSDERCFSTKRRQEAIDQAAPDTDLFIILGSSTSNNTAKLYDLAKKKYPSAFVLRVLNLEELRKVSLFGHKKAALASGASTSNETFQAVLNYLRSR
jgi:4-hydroxy-3-methylbut-2-enyl diphosphate reductase